MQRIPSSVCRHHETGVVVPIGDVNHLRRSEWLRIDAECRVTTDQNVQPILLTYRATNSFDNHCAAATADYSERRAALVRRRRERSERTCLVELGGLLPPVCVALGPEDRGGTYSGVHSKSMVGASKKTVWSVLHPKKVADELQAAVHRSERAYSPWLPDAGKTRRSDCARTRPIGGACRKAL